VIAAVRQSDVRYAASRRLLLSRQPKDSFYSGHSMAEVYSSLSGMRPPHRFHPKQALTVVESLGNHLQCVTLTADEVLATVKRTAALGLMGGIIYDALLMACARKVDAESIYTWNADDFKLLAPDLAERIVTP
jgi:predicted nucleic acid-binding protein